MELDPSVAAAGVGLVIHDTIGSTNTEALNLARNGERGPLWIVARQQSAGRGRRGRAWVSEPGNLYATLLMTDPAPPHRAAELSFVAALALHDAVGGQIPDMTHRLGLKWPNDLLIDRSKFAGILIEGEGPAVAIGIGVNCVHHPANTAFPATDLAAAGIRSTPDSLFFELSATMDRRFKQWNRGEGFGSIRTDWLERAAGLGKPIRLILAEGERSGHFEGIDDNGRLLMRLTDGAMEAITAGDVMPPHRREPV